MSTTWQLTLDFLPLLMLPMYSINAADDGSIMLPRPPAIAVTSIDFIDAGGTVRTLAPSTYIVSTGTPGRIYPSYGSFWPFTQPRPAAVNIIYTAGYGTDPALVPPNVGTAILMLTAHYYAHRSEQAEVPDAVANLLGPSRWGGYA